MESHDGLIHRQFLEQPTEPYALFSEHGFGVWFLPCCHPLLPFLPSYILKRKGLISQGLHVLPLGKVSLAIGKATSIARGLCSPGGLGLWSRGSRSLLVLLRRLLTGYRQQGEGCALESFKPVCDLMVLYSGKASVRKALCYTPEGPAQCSQ